MNKIGNEYLIRVKIKQVLFSEGRLSSLCPTTRINKHHQIRNSSRDMKLLHVTNSVFWYFIYVEQMPVTTKCKSVFSKLMFTQTARTGLEMSVMN